jgi:ABC-2 type transport system permease protein
MRTLRRYHGFFRIAAVQAASERGELYGRVVFFPVILGIFSALWRAVGDAGMPMHASPEQLVWYLAVTEWILLSAPVVHLDIQVEVRRGDVAYQLPRPVSYLGARLAQNLGMLAVRAPVLAVVAFAAAFAFTRQTPDPWLLLDVVPFGLWASALVSVMHTGVGLLAFWLTDVSPVVWVVNKSMFVLGGLMLPLELYPAYVQRIGACTPFPWLLSAPAGFIIGSTQSHAGVLALGLSVWSLALALGLSALFRLAKRSLQLSGG